MPRRTPHAARRTPHAARGCSEDVNVLPHATALVLRDALADPDDVPDLLLLELHEGVVPGLGLALALGLGSGSGLGSGLGLGLGLGLELREGVVHAIVELLLEGEPVEVDLGEGEG